MHLSPIICPNPDCGDHLPFAATSCPGCGCQNVGYPNVRYADDPAEIAALDATVNNAYKIADRNGSTSKLHDFENAVDISCAVTVMSIGDLLYLLGRNRLWVSFYKQVRGAGIRIAEENKWDMNRGSNDQKINPQYYDEINYAVLSLSDYGSGWYGGCHIKLHNSRIASRTTVFWENPFQFLKHTHLPPDAVVPPGYRAAWPRRAKLAVAKLHKKVKADTRPESFSDIVLERDPTRGDTDFIEVHIFGSVAPSAMSLVSVEINSMSDDDKLEWQSVKRRLSSLGISVNEISC